MRPFGILWDLDGVLIDTGEFHYQAWANTLAAHNIPYSREAFRATFGMNNLSTLTALLNHPPPPELVRQIDEEKEAAFRAASKGRAVALPGAVAWLDRWQKLGARQALASSAPQANIDMLLDELGLRHYFAAIVSGAKMAGKPDPAVFLEAARRLDLPPAQCIVIEDSGAGVTAAKRGGMPCVAVTNTNPASVLKDAGADLVLDSLERLPLDAVGQLLDV